MYMGASNDNLNKLHKVIMRSARTARNNYCCRMSINQILSSCKWMTIKNMIAHSAITTIHTILTKKTPTTIYNLFTNTHNTRINKKISLRCIPRTAKFKKFYLNSGLELYNKIPQDIKSKSIHSFKKLTKKWLITNITIDSHD